MRERPILFRPEMVRAILSGTKTQTRRLVTDRTSQGNWKASEMDLATAWVDPGPSPVGNPGPYLKARPLEFALQSRGFTTEDRIVDRLYPRVFVGHRLWVRETWEDSGLRQPFNMARGGPMLPPVLYAADLPDSWQGHTEYTRRPSIHMPRWASRLTLEVTEVGVQRLQETKESEARAEGIVLRDAPEDEFTARAVVAVDGRKYLSVGSAFAALWDSISGKRAPWSSNPWVWAITFKRCA